jgi:hypothetical protein
MSPFSARAIGAASISTFLLIDRASWVVPFQRSAIDFHPTLFVNAVIRTSARSTKTLHFTMIYNYLLVALFTCLSLCMAVPLPSTIHSSSSCIMQLIS